MMNDTFGVDIGGVLIDRANNGSDTSFFSQRFLETTAVPGAFAALALLARERFGGRVHLVSKCGARTEERTKLWLAHHDFEAITGIGPTHLHFCRERRDKAPICAALGVTHFVDDRLEVLSYLPTMRRRYLLNAIESEVAKHARFLPDVTRVAHWRDIVTALTA